MESIQIKRKQNKIKKQSHDMNLAFIKYRSLNGIIKNNKKEFAPKLMPFIK